MAAVWHASPQGFQSRLDRTVDINDSRVSTARNPPRTANGVPLDLNRLEGTNVDSVWYARGRARSRLRGMDRGRHDKATTTIPCRPSRPRGAHCPAWPPNNAQTREGVRGGGARSASTRLVALERRPIALGRAPRLARDNAAAVAARPSCATSISFKNYEPRG